MALITNNTHKTTYNSKTILQVRLEIKIALLTTDKQNALCQNWNTSVKAHKNSADNMYGKADNKCMSIIDDLHYNPKRMHNL